jgi:hypothetical protein
LVKFIGASINTTLLHVVQSLLFEAGNTPSKTNSAYSFQKMLL